MPSLGLPQRMVTFESSVANAIPTCLPQPPTNSPLAPPCASSWATPLTIKDTAALTSLPTVIISRHVIFDETVFPFAERDGPRSTTELEFLDATDVVPAPIGPLHTVLPAGLPPGVAPVAPLGAATASSDAPGAPASPSSAVPGAPSDDPPALYVPPALRSPGALTPAPAPRAASPSTLVPAPRAATTTPAPSSTTPRRLYVPPALRAAWTSQQ